MQAHILGSTFRVSLQDAWAAWPYAFSYGPWSLVSAPKMLAWAMHVSVNLAMAAQEQSGEIYLGA